MDENGKVYVADTGNQTIRKITSNGTVTTLAGTPGLQGSDDYQPNTNGSIFPVGTHVVTYDATDVSGNRSSASFHVTVVDSTAPSLTLPPNVAVFATTGNGAKALYSPATATDIVTANPAIAYSHVSGTTFGMGVTTITVTATDAANNVRSGTFTVTVLPPPSIERQPVGGTVISGSSLALSVSVRGGAALTYQWQKGISPMVSTIAGTGAMSPLSNPTGVCIDAFGNVYVADSGNYRIVKITPAGEVSTLAGSVAGNVDGRGTAARFNYPSGVAVDWSGNVYVADTSNNKIRKITPAGDVTTLAGSGISGSTDGSGETATFTYPEGVAVDGNGNVYVADSFNNKIRRITPTGEVTTVAGSGIAGSTDGNGAVATFNYPAGVAVDPSGNLYVADLFNYKIRKITPNGEVSTFAGSGNYGSIDGVGAESAFSYPKDVCLDTLGNIYVADFTNCKIRKITPKESLINSKRLLQSDL